MLLAMTAAMFERCIQVYDEDTVTSLVENYIMFESCISVGTIDTMDAIDTMGRDKNATRASNNFSDSLKYAYVGQLFPLR